MTGRAIRAAAAAVALLGTAGCRSEHPNPQNAETASIYHPDSGSGPGTNMSAGLQAPPLIPAIRVQLDQMANAPAALTDSNLTAFRQMAGTLVNTMTADLTRLGYPDQDEWKALTDSIHRDYGGTASGPDRGQIPAHVARVRRLLAMYDNATRSAAR